MQVFVDLDGVLADFDGRYERLFGVRPDRNGAEPPHFWKNISSTPRFFADMDPLRDAMALWQGIVSVTGTEPIILTGLPRHDGVLEEKREWVDRHFGGAVYVIGCASRDKCHYGHPGDVLIDDWVKYRPLWQLMGGHFILHTSAEQSLRELRAYRFTAGLTPVDKVAEVDVVSAIGDGEADRGQSGTGRADEALRHPDRGDAPAE